MLAEEDQDVSEMALVDDEGVREGLPSSACRGCGLYSACTPERAFAEAETCGQRGGPLVLVIISGYAPDAFSEDRPGGFLLRLILSGLEGVRWAVTGTHRCPAPERTKKAELEQHRACSAAFIPVLQTELRPDVVVLMGLEAMKVILGKSAPKSILNATKKTIRLGLEGAPPVLIGRSPWAHRPDEGDDLKGEFVELFKRAEKLALGQTSMSEFPYQEISHVPEAVRICNALPEDFTFDPEYGAHEDDPVRRTFWHPGATLLCWSLVWKSHTGERQAVTFVPPAANDPRVWEAAFRGRRPCAHFAKNDFQTPYALERIDVFPWIKRLPTGECDFRDPGAEIHTCDQSRPGLGILSLAMVGWEAANWKQLKDDLIAAANKRLEKEWNDLKAWEQRRGDAWEAVKAWEELAKKRKHYMTQLEGSEHGDRLHKGALRWLDKNPPYARPADPPRPPTPVRPKGTCGYEAAIPYLYHYCAEDSIHTQRAIDELVPTEMARLGGSGPLVRRLLSRITEFTCKVERIGLPVDESRVQAAYAEFQDAVLEAKKSLIREMPVALAVQDQKGYQEEVRKRGDPYGAALTYLNPLSTDFRLALAVRLGENLKSFPKTDSGAPSINKAVLYDLGEPEESWETCSYKAKVWRAFAQLKNAQDLISKLGMFRWTVDGVIRTDYRVVKVDRPDHDGAGEGEGGTETGRLSAGYLQGLKKDPAFRACFVAPPGWIFLEADYSTLEPRVLSFLANIPEWQEWFEKDLDLYCGLANRMYDLGVDIGGENAAKLLRACIEDEERQLMKRCFLAQMYMQGARSLAIAAGIPLEKAEDFAQYFHKAFPQLKKLQRRLWDAMVTGKPVTTPFGRQAYAKLPHDKDRDKDSKMADLHRHFWNFPTQGTGSDTCLWLGWVFMKRLEAAGWWGVRGGICNLVHDSLLSLVKIEHFTEYAKLKIKTMEDRSLLPFKMPVGITVELKAGFELSVMEKVDKADPQIPVKLLQTVSL